MKSTRINIIRAHNDFLERVKLVALIRNAERKNCIHANLGPYTARSLFNLIWIVERRDCDYAKLSGVAIQNPPEAAANGEVTSVVVKEDGIEQPKGRAEPVLTKPLTIESAIAFLSRNMDKSGFAEMLDVSAAMEKNRSIPIPTNPVKAADNSAVEQVKKVAQNPTNVAIPATGPAKPVAEQAKKQVQKPPSGTASVKTKKPKSQAVNGSSKLGRPSEVLMDLHRGLGSGNQKLTPPQQKADKSTEPLRYNPDNPPPLNECLMKREILFEGKPARIKGYDLSNECQPQIKVEWANNTGSKQNNFNLIVKAHI